MKNSDYIRLKNEITSFIEVNLKEKRLKHTYSVAEEAVRLAEMYGEDVKKAELAALFHDMFRSMPTSVLNMYIEHLPGFPGSSETIPIFPTERSRRLL